ncbi:hypothetical protein QYE76_009734 [Lolium multiflorum]|uniref:Uncharacterized protein n=1 Tax=Lolium multiflorum TaxID=4521 RepID=A0AAD8TU67_LOLMU|nr:hypothetical protein QYE76_009734 [Lolium multiflorum]
MDVLAAAATTMDAEETLAPVAAPHSPVAMTIATMEVAAPAEATRAANGGKEGALQGGEMRRGREASQPAQEPEGEDCCGRQPAGVADADESRGRASSPPSELSGGYMLVKREGIAGVAPPASSVSSISSQLRPETPAPLQGHPASRVASGVAPVQFTDAPLPFNGAPVPDLNRTPRSGYSRPSATHKTRQLPEESMLEPRILFDEMAPPAPTMDDPPTHPTPVCVDNFDDAPTQPVLTTDNAIKKKGESHMTQGFIDDEDKCLCGAWLATSHDCINGAQQKGKVYWAKVMQEYNEIKMHPPYHIPNPRTEESLRKRLELHQTRDKQVRIPGLGEVHKKGFHMVHCWDKLKDAEKWKTSFAAYNEALKNGTTVNLDGEDDDQGRQALPPRPRGHKATKTVKPFHLVPETIRLPSPI